MGSLIMWAVVAVVILYIIVVYNGLVTLKNAVSRNWSNIDILLKQRHDELPKLVETCKQYMQFEQDALQKVMLARSGIDTARKSGDIKTLGAAETALRGGLGSINATVEAYPELKANQSIQQLMGRITGLENAISDRREFYNESVNSNNVRIEQFPDLIVARLFNFGPQDLLVFTEEEKSDVDVRKLFRT